MFATHYIDVQQDINIVTATRSGTYIFWDTPKGSHQKK
jgi:hypothetical protein